MRALRYALIALAVLAALAFAGLALVLPSWVESAGFREQMQSLAREHLGREVDYGDVAVRIFPPRVDVAQLSVGGVGPKDEPALRAERASLVLGWRGLLRGRAIVDAIVVEGAELRMVRTAKGLDLLAAAVPAAPAAAAASARSGGASDGAPPPVELERASLRDARIVFDDRVAAPPVVWTLEGVDVDVRARSLDGPFAFSASGRSADGGEIEASGELSPSGPIDAELALDDFEAGALRSYIDAIERVSGPVDLELAVDRASADAPLSIDAKLASRALELATGDLVARGPVAASAKLARAGEKWSGPFSVDLSDAELDYAGGVVRKPAGTRALLDGTLSSDERGGLRADYELRIRNAEAKGALLTAPRLRVEIDAAPFELAGFEEIVPALADLAPTGTLALERLTFAADPPSLGGSLALAKVALAQATPDTPVVLDGHLDARGSALVPRELFATVGAARLSVEGEIADLFGERRLALRLATPQPVESNAVFSMVDAMRDAVFGALDLDLSLALPLAGAAAQRPATDRLRGDVRFQIGGDEAGGRLRGVSLLRTAFDRFGALGYAALLALPAKRGKSIEEYYSESFRVARATFRVENGEARTQDFEVVHDEYTTRLRGGLRLSDLALDMRGELEIGPRLDAALSGSANGQSRVIPLARVGGTALDPSVSLRAEDVAAFAARYVIQADSKLGRKIDDAIGGTAGGILRDVLSGGSRSQRERPAPAPASEPAPVDDVAVPSEPEAPVADAPPAPAQAPEPIEAPAPVEPEAPTAEAAPATGDPPAAESPSAAP